MHKLSLIERFHEHEELADKFYALDVEILKMLDVETFCRALPKKVAALFTVPHCWLTFIDDSRAARFVRGKSEVLLVKRDTFVGLLPQAERPLRGQRKPQRLF